MNIITCTAKSTDGKEKLLLIGLTKKNISDMRKGMDVRLTPQKNSIPEGLVIDLVYGEDTAGVVRILKAKGLINDKTEVEVRGKPVPEGIIPVEYDQNSSEPNGTPMGDGYRNTIDPDAANN